MRNNSLPVLVAGLGFAVAVTAAETAAVANAVNLFTAGYTRGSQGNRIPNLAVFPEGENYDRLRLDFGEPVLDGTVTALVLVAYAWHPSGNKRLLGKSTLDGDDLFPAIEFEGTTEPIEVIVQTITGADAELTSLDTYVTGIIEVED